MATLPTFTDLTDEQIATIRDAFKPFPDATEEDTDNEFLSWLRSKLQPEIQRRLYVKLHSGLGDQEKEIEHRSHGALPPDPNQPKDDHENQGHNQGGATP